MGKVHEQCHGGHQQEWPSRIRPIRRCLAKDLIPDEGRVDRWPKMQLDTKAAEIATPLEENGMELAKDLYNTTSNVGCRTFAGSHELADGRAARRKPMPPWPSCPSNCKT